MSLYFVFYHTTLVFPSLVHTIQSISLSSRCRHVDGARGFLRDDTLLAFGLFLIEV